MLIQIAMKDTNNTGVDEITRSLFSYFTVRCSLGEFLFATDHVVAGARFIYCRSAEYEEGFVYTLPVTLHHVPPRFSALL